MEQRGDDTPDVAVKKSTTDTGKSDSRKRKNPFNSQLRKEEKERRQKKRARLIVRNISYKATEESLREHFQKFGEIEELNLLKRPSDGRLVGCAFVQYATVNQATKAIFKANNQPFLGRPVFVDWALGKDEYLAKKGEVKGELKVELKEEEKKPKIEDEEHSVQENNADSQIDNEESGNSDEDESIDSESEDEDDHNEGPEMDSADDLDSDTKDDKKVIKPEADIQEDKKQKHISNDVQECCTVFIKNVPFDADDNDLRKVCRKFGPVYYAIINREPISGHSKGTGFVKFKTKESADLCLQAGTEFALFDQALDPHPALSREEIRTQILEKSKKDENKDSRNLYLAREGLIMSGSKAAVGVSASDMSKRHELERVKTQVLKNLNRFVSRNRLSIHNLPLSYDNDKLKQMVISYTGFRPHECRVMREYKITPDHPKGKSKGFGFMSFNTHQQALTALRKLNNNPKIFNDTHRPIVAFSIEDRAVTKIKEKREEKSKLNNPTYQEKLQRRREKRKVKSNKVGPMVKLPKALKQDDKTKLKKQIKKLEQKRAEAKAGTSAKKVNEEFQPFVGTASKPGTSIRMRSNKKIKEQSQEHMKRVKADKRKEKQRKIRQIHLSERKATDRPKQGRKVERDDLSKLVKKYRRLIGSGDAAATAATHMAGAVGTRKQKRPIRMRWYRD